jgi:hypothetical protein
LTPTSRSLRKKRTLACRPAGWRIIASAPTSAQRCTPITSRGEPGDPAAEPGIDRRHVDLADGDLVMLHSNVVLVPGTKGSAGVDIFRVEHGKLVEHWTSSRTSRTPPSAARAGRPTTTVRDATSGHGQDGHPTEDGVVVVYGGVAVVGEAPDVERIPGRGVSRR